MKAFLKAATASDKLLHAAACYVIVVTVAAALRHYGSAIFVALVCALGAGIGKEAWGKAHGGEFDTWDLLADFIGTFAGAVCALLLLTA